MVENVILDSLLFLNLLPAWTASLLDIGSGPGIPGIPIKIARPELAVTMAESRGKRAAFLSAAVRTLCLGDARVFDGRAEALLAEPGRYDVVVARCSGPAEQILALGEKLAARPGRVVVTGRRRGSREGTASLITVTNPVSGDPRVFLVQDLECLDRPSGDSDGPRELRAE